MYYCWSKKGIFAKLFIVISAVGLFTYAMLALYSRNTDQDLLNKKIASEYETRMRHFSTEKQMKRQRRQKMKYILQWVAPNSKIITEHEFQGQKPFVYYNCSYKNCYITTKARSVFTDYRKFDAVIIDASLAKIWKSLTLPKLRSPSQKYVFHGDTSSKEQTICNAKADGYFNWTWSYKLSSDIFTPFFEVRDRAGRTIAPANNIVWTDMYSYKYSIIEDLEKLKLKRKAVSWVMNACHTKNDRVFFVKQLKSVLKTFDLQLDIFGCEFNKCGSDQCSKLITRDYYFYMVYEDSIVEDYLTTEVLKGYLNYAVPIVITGADLTKFLPVGSYIDGRNSTVEKLASLIHYYIRKPGLYYNMHIWRNYYTFHEVDRKSGICQLCSLLNNANLVRTRKTYWAFRKWWYQGSLKDKCAPKSVERYTELLSYMNESAEVKLTSPKFFGEKRLTVL